MKALVIEDEYVAAQNLQRMLAGLSPDIEVLTVLQTVEDSVEWLQTNPMPELVFLDIHLADGSSFAIFDRVQITCPIIFTTAYDEYALKAFEVNSIDYLLKPIAEKQLERSLEKFRKFKTAGSDNLEALNALLNSFKYSKESYKSNFLIPYKDKLIPLSIDKIACFYIDSKSVMVLTFDQRSFSMDTSLDDLSHQLDPDLFFRANRQYIIAHKAIQDLSMWFGSKISVNLMVTVPERIIVSKAKVHEFKEWYTQH